MIISPSILNVEDNKKIEYIKKLEENQITYLHLDVMDGKFVTNTTFDDKYIKTLREHSKMIFDTHLMVKEPEKVINDYILSGSDYITFHIEATSKPYNIIETLKRNNKKIGISIKPNTILEEILEFLPFIDLVLVMSVEPGRGGQSFIMHTLDKIKTLKQLKEERNYNYLIEVDGGINNETAPLVKEAGADMIVVGSYLVKQPDLSQAIKELKKI